MYAGGASRLGRAANWFFVKPFKPFSLWRLTGRCALALMAAGSFMGAADGVSNRAQITVTPSSSCMNAERFCAMTIEGMNTNFLKEFRVVPDAGSGLKVAQQSVSGPGKATVVVDIADANPGTWGVGINDIDCGGLLTLAAAE